LFENRAALTLMIYRVKFIQFSLRKLKEFNFTLE